MKIVHLVAGDLNGGAARGAVNLHFGLLDLDVNSYILSNSYTSPNILGTRTLCYSPLRSLINRLSIKISRLPLLLYPRKSIQLFNTGYGGVDFFKNEIYQEADIIHLHWINGLVSLSSLKRIRKPIVWTLRDMWPITGGCHYTLGCEHYKKRCSLCPQLDSKSNYDLSRLIFSQKNKSYPSCINFVGISNWISTCARNSFLLRRHNIRTIPMPFQYVLQTYLPYQLY